MKHLTLIALAISLLVESSQGEELPFGDTVTVDSTSTVSEPSKSEGICTFKLALDYDIGHPATMVVMFTTRDHAGRKISSSEWQFAEGRVTLQFQVLEEYIPFSYVSYTFLPNSKTGFGFNSDLKKVTLRQLTDYLEQLRDTAIIELGREFIRAIQADNSDRFAALYSTLGKMGDRGEIDSLDRYWFIKDFELIKHAASKRFDLKALENVNVRICRSDLPEAPSIHLDITFSDPEGKSWRILTGELVNYVDNVWRFKNRCLLPLVSHNGRHAK